MSKDPSGRVKSVSGQIQDAERVISANGWTPGPVITDNDLSASRYAVKDRPGYRQLLAELRAGDVLVLWERSRSGRKLEDWVELRQLCTVLGVLLCISGRVYDMSDPTDRQTLGFTAVQDEAESDRLSKRIRDEKRRTAESGGVNSKLPWGYRREFTGGAKQFHWVIDETYGPMVRELADHLLAGKSIYSLCRQWNSAGRLHPNGNPWYPKLIRFSAMNPVYAGRKVHRRRDIGPGGTWPAILSESEHFRLLALLGDPSRLTHRGAAPRHLGSGIYECGRCGSTMASRHNAYTCKAHAHVSRREDWTDKVVVAAVLQEIEDWQFHTLVLDIEEDDDGNLLLPADAESQRCADKAAELRGRLDSFVLEAAAGRLSAGALVRIEAELLPQIADAEQGAKRVTVPPLVAAVARNPRQVWEGLGVEEKRSLLRLAVRVVILPTGRRGRVFDPASVVVESRLPDRAALARFVTG